jgi:hypothetical protein
MAFQSLSGLYPPSHFWVDRFLNSDSQYLGIQGAASSGLSIEHHGWRPLANKVDRLLTLALSTYHQLSKPFQDICINLPFQICV